MLSWLCGPVRGEGHIPVALWPGFPAGGRRLEQHCPAVSQPPQQHRVQIRSKVTVLVRDSCRGEGRRGRSLACVRQGPRATLSVPGQVIYTFQGQFSDLQDELKGEGKGILSHHSSSMSLFPRLGPRDWNHNSGHPTHLGEVPWGQGWSPEAKPSRQQADQQTVACRHPRPLPSPEAPLWDQWGPELHGEHTEQRLKSVEWSSLPFGGTSSSGGTGSDSSSGRLAVPYRMHKVMGHPPCTPGHSSEPTEPHWRRFSRETQAQPEGGVQRVSPGCAPTPHCEAGISAQSP